jgi:hypothetical protein
MDAQDFAPHRLGRFGGVVAIIAGMTVLVAGAVLLTESWMTGIDETGAQGVLVVPIGALLLGPMMVAAGVFALLRSAPTKAKPTMPVSEARWLVADRATPFWVCTRCRTFMDRDWGVGCAECGSSVDVLGVETDIDRSTVTAALGSAR